MREDQDKRRSARINALFLSLILLLGSAFNASAQAPPQDDAPKLAPARTPASVERPSGYGGMLLQMVLSLAIVCVVAFVALKWGLKRFTAHQSHDGLIKVLARHTLEPRRALIVAQVGPRYLILSSSEAGVQLVTELEPEQALPFLEAQSKKSSAFEGALVKAKQNDKKAPLELLADEAQDAEEHERT